MQYSQNGYTVLDGWDSCRVYKIDNLKLSLRPDDCGWLLKHFAVRFDRRVENLNPTDCHGFSRRAISGTNEWSNHASGTAIDLNATKHPYGSRGTFSNIKISAIRDLLENYDGAIRWGGDYHSTVDEMHFEVVKPYDFVKLVKGRIRRKGVVYLDKLRPGNRNIDVFIVKRELFVRGYSVGSLNNYFGTTMKNAYAEWQRTLGFAGVDADGIPGPTSLGDLGLTVR